MVNCIVLQGRLCADAELKQSESGVKFCNFLVASNRTYGKEKKTDFVPCVAYNRNAEFIEKYFHKGEIILIEGELQSSSYERAGQKVYSMKVSVQKVHFSGARKEEDRTFIPADEDRYDRDDIFDFPL